MELSNWWVVVEVFTNLFFRVYHLLNFAVYIIGVLWMIKLKLQLSKLSLHLVCLLLIHESVNLFSCCSVSFKSLQFWCLEIFLSFAKLVLDFSLSITNLGV